MFFSCFIFIVHCSLFLIPYFLFPIPYSLFPIPYSFISFKISPLLSPIISLLSRFLLFKSLFLRLVITPRFAISISHVMRTMSITDIQNMFKHDGIELLKSCYLHRIIPARWMYGVWVVLWENLSSELFYSPGHNIFIN